MPLVRECHCHEINVISALPKTSRFDIHLEEVNQILRTVTAISKSVNLFSSEFIFIHFLNDALLHNSYVFVLYDNNG